MKTCHGCGETKPFYLFPRAKHLKSGFSTRCKECWRLINAASRKKQREARQHKKQKEKQRQERERQVELAITRKGVCKKYITPDHDFLLDLHWVLIESLFMRGRRNPFARIQFIETGTIIDDTHSTDL